MTVFFGANDACIYPNPQCVPLSQYSANLIKIITHPLVKAHSPRIMLITPPPINEYLQATLDMVKGYDPPRRSADNTKRYADATREVGKDLGIPVLDMWMACMLEAGWEPGEELPGSRALPESPVLQELLHDGLHLSPAGYRLLYKNLTTLIAKTWPDQVPDRIPFVLPAWDDKDKWRRFQASIE